MCCTHGVETQLCALDIVLPTIAQGEYPFSALPPPPPLLPALQVNELTMPHLITSEQADMVLFIGKAVQLLKNPQGAMRGVQLLPASEALQMKALMDGLQSKAAFDAMAFHKALELIRAKVTGLGWAGLGWAGLGWAGLGWAGLGWADWACITCLGFRRWLWSRGLAAPECCLAVVLVVDACVSPELGACGAPCLSSTGPVSVPVGK
jgi:hypothetical protein